jgi:threonine dehydrogenase-like Zn-dependent dehydrogenase
MAKVVFGSPTRRSPKPGPYQCLCRIEAYATYENAEIVGKLIPADRLLSAATGEVLAHPYMLDAVRLGLVKSPDFYSHRMPFERICEGFDLLRNKKAFKIVFEMEKA